MFILVSAFAGELINGMGSIQPIVGTFILAIISFLFGPVVFFSCFSVALSASSIIPIVYSWIDISLLNFPISSTSWILETFLVAAVFFVCIGQIKAAIGSISLILPSYLYLSVAAYGGWLTVSELTSPIIRYILPLIFLAHTYPLISNQCEYGKSYEFSKFKWLIPFLCGSMAFISITLIQANKISGIIFDESHGKWETVDSKFGPNDFGRGVNYTYSLLKDYSKKLVGSSNGFYDEENALPTFDYIFVLKVPTQPLSTKFQEKLKKWVSAGGRLLIIGDHTDLYDHAQIINKYLEHISSIRILSNDTFDANGLPNTPSHSTLFRILGRLDAVETKYPWLTGTSTAYIPLNAVILADFGNSFSENGDYGLPNRFGTFNPATWLPYSRLPAVISIPVGSGQVVIVLDSTPWSNFSFFREEYRRLFRGVIGVFSEQISVHIIGMLIPCLFVLAFITSMTKKAFSFYSLISILVIISSLGLRISGASTEPSKEGRDYDLKVEIGSFGKLEFLPQLITPGENNYSRIISSLSKYELSPSANLNNGQKIDLSLAKKWLVIDPELESLPLAEDIFKHLRTGGSFALLLSPYRASHISIRAWLTSLDLKIEDSSSLVFAEDSNRRRSGTFSLRRGASLLRDNRAVTTPREEGLLKEYTFDRLWQTYTIRPTKLPRTSGFLTIGFSADQVTDAAVGEVWDGIRPSSLGGLRERQLALLLRNGDSGSPWPDKLAISSSINTKTKNLRSYLLFEDGRIILDSTLTEKDLETIETRPIAFADTPKKWLADLRSRALKHISERCQAINNIMTLDSKYECADRLISPDGIEWLVSYKKQKNYLKSIELLHEKRWSGVGANINVIFSD